MKTRLITLLVVLTITITTSFAQHCVRYDADPRIALIEQAHTQAWDKINTIEGYRIQIIAVSGNNSRKTAQTVMEEFATTYPEMPIYISYYEPNFRVRVGDYREKIDAAHDLVEIKKLHPGAFIVKDDVNYR